MQILRSPSRVLFLGTFAAVFIGVSVGHAIPPGIPSNIQNRAYAYHGQGNLVTRVDENTDIYDGSANTIATLNYVFPYPNNVNPTYLVGCSPGQGGIRRINPNDAAPIPPDAVTLGGVNGGTFVNVAPMKPHYFFTMNYAGTVTSTLVSYYDPFLHAVVDNFAPPGNTLATGGGCTFAKTTNGAGTPFFRWFWNDVPPNTTGGGTGTIYAIDFRTADIIESGGTPDPWNPSGALTYGPPFNNFSVQMQSASWGGKGGIPAASFGGSNADTNQKMATWTNPVTGTNYIIIAYDQIVNLTPIIYQTALIVYNADSPNFPLAAVRAWNAGSTSGTTPVMQDMKVFGNYLCCSTGKQSLSAGGAEVNFWYLPVLIATGVAASARGVGVLWPGATGVGVSFDQQKFYIGNDDSSDSYGVGAVNPVSFAAGVGFMNDVLAGNSIIGTLQGHRCLTDQELTQLNPPNRTYPGVDWVSYQINLNPLLNFPNTNTGAGTQSRHGVCSVASNGQGSGIGGIVLSMVLLGLVLATLREASRT